MTPEQAGLIEYVISGIVWIVGLLVFGGLGRYIATQHFARLKRLDKANDLNRS